MLIHKILVLSDESVCVKFSVYPFYLGNVVSYNCAGSMQSQQCRRAARTKPSVCVCVAHICAKQSIDGRGGGSQHVQQVEKRDGNAVREKEHVGKYRDIVPHAQHCKNPPKWLGVQGCRRGRFFAMHMLY